MNFQGAPPRGWVWVKEKVYCEGLFPTLNLHLNSIVLQWATTEPEFNEQFVFITNIVDLPKQVGNLVGILFATYFPSIATKKQRIHIQSLAVTVWHHDKMKQNDYLGTGTELCSW